MYSQHRKILAYLPNFHNVSKMTDILHLSVLIPAFPTGAQPLQKKA